MLTLAVIGAAKLGGAGLLAKLIGALIGLGAVGFAFAPPALQFKNSGILRYLFGNFPGAETPTPLTPTGSPSGRGPLVAADGPTILYCLGGTVGGAGANAATPDMDYQLFGMSPGHAANASYYAAGAQAATLFAGSTPSAKDADPVGTRVQGDPNTGQGPAGGSPAGARIPAGTKVLAWFATCSATGIGPVIVQTEVFQNRIFKGGVEDATGPQWLSIVRVAVQGLIGGGAGTAGILYVKLQHSHLDIPGSQPQSVNFVGTPAA